MTPTRIGTTIRHYMTPSPFTIGAEQTLEAAHAVMREHRVRHLPVLHGGKLVGIISQRDLMLIESLPGVNPKEVPVEDAMTTDIYTVSPSTTVAKVAVEMAERKLGSAIVVSGDEVIGVFTVTDACQVLAELIGRRPPRSSRSPRSRRPHPRVRPAARA